MQALAPLLALLLAEPALAADPAPEPLPTLLEEGISAAEGPARFRLQPPAGALVGIADANGDGFADVVVLTSRGRGAWILPGDGKGDLGAVERIAVPGGPHGVGDLDADGAAEQLYGGGFGTETVLVPGKPDSAAPALTADLDGDGSLDLVRVGDGALRIGAEILPVGRETVSLASADLDRDGTLDLLAADAQAEEVSVFLGNAQGGFRAAGAHRVWVRPFSLAAGDLDADGAVDLVVADQCGGTMSVLRGDGSGGFGTPIVITQAAGPPARGGTDAAAPPTVKALTLSPSTLSGASGASSTVTVRLDGPAPADGLRLRLRSSDPRLVAPEDEVIVAAGETSASFEVAPSVQGRRGRLSYLATLTATAASDGSSASATLTVKAP